MNIYFISAYLVYCFVVSSLYGNSAGKRNFSFLKFALYMTLPAMLNVAAFEVIK